MNKEIISFLQQHNFMNHKGNCDITPEKLALLSSGKIILEQFYDLYKCDATCGYYLKHKVKCRLLEVGPDIGEPIETGCTTTHCFRNLSHSILDSEGEDYSGTFVERFPKQ
jgi:hypothetical protein